MSAQKIAAILLIVLGALGLIYGGFSYTKERHEANLGPVHFSVDEKERVNIPLWVGVAALVVGGVLLTRRN